jgi:hypothetical protein
MALGGYSAGGPDLLRSFLIWGTATVQAGFLTPGTAAVRGRLRGGGLVAAGFGWLVGTPLPAPAWRLPGHRHPRLRRDRAHPHPADGRGEVHAGNGAPGLTARPRRQPGGSLGFTASPSTPASSGWAWP